MELLGQEGFLEEVTMEQGLTPECMGFSKSLGTFLGKGQSRLPMVYYRENGQQADDAVLYRALNAMLRSMDLTLWTSGAF